MIHPPLIKSNNHITTATRWDSGFTRAEKHPGYVVKNGKTIDYSIQTLFARSDTSILVGYGDYGENDGPTSIISFNPFDNSYSVYGTIQSESIQVFRSYGGDIYIPYIDPTGYWEDSYPYVILNNDNELVYPSKANFLHAYDLAIFDNKIFLCGSKNINNGGYEIIIMSEDNGKTFSYTELTGIPGQLRRATKLVEKDGNLYVYSGDTSWDVIDMRWYKYDNGTWVPSADINIEQNYTTVPEEFSPYGVTAYARTNYHEVIGTLSGNIYTRKLNKEI